LKIIELLTEHVLCGRMTFLDAFNWTQNMLNDISDDEDSDYSIIYSYYGLINIYKLIFKVYLFYNIITQNDPNQNTDNTFVIEVNICKKNFFCPKIYYIISQKNNKKIGNILINIYKLIFKIYFFFII